MASYEFKKKKGNMTFFLVLFFIIGGYAFFFTSTSWMPLGADVKLLTPLGEEQEWEDRKIKIVRWEYCEEKELMELELDIDNNAFDGVNTYEYSAVDRAGDELIIKKMLEEPDWVIIQIYGVSNEFGEVSFRIDYPRKKDEGETLKLYTNMNDVKKVEKLEKKTRTGYVKGRFMTEKATYEKSIKNREKRIKSLTYKNEQMQIEIERLQKDITYQTEEQQAETIDKVNEIMVSQTDNVEEIRKLQEEVREYKERVVLIEKQMLELRE